MNPIQVHFWVLKNLWRQFKDIFSDLGYSTKSEFFRDTIRWAIQEASEIENHHQKAIVVARKGDMQRLKFGSEKDLGQGGQIVTKALKGKVIEVHFNVPEELWRRFLAVLRVLGYSSASEFFRAKIREAISKRRDSPV
jgi:metal-responsive CopG/Arc/MetJ family transcriptional regulator